VVVMIVEWFFSIGVSVLGWLSSLLPTWDVPDWFANLDGNVNTVVQFGDGMGAWIDTTTIGAVISAVFIAMGIGFAVKLVLKVTAITHISGSD
jgi:hypothetical protein